MNIILISILIALILILAFIIFKLQQQLKQQTTDLSSIVEQKINESFRQANQSLLEMAKQSLQGEKQIIKTDLENKRDEINRLVELIRQELQKNQEKLLDSEKDRIKSFSMLVQELEEYKKITKELSTSTESLKKILSNNQMRGQFGEQVAEDLLKMAGFVKGYSYEYNKSQDSRSSRPDFTIFLPDKTKINVDVKFPYSNLQKMSETQNQEEKNKYKKLFEQDVKAKIKEVSTRDYINPEDNTVDFVILFIPNEMIFSFIYDQLDDIWQEALKKKVVLAGPFSFVAILRMIKQSYQYFSFQNNLNSVHQNILAFIAEFQKFDEEFRKIGTHLDKLNNTYNRVSTTRYNQLVRKMDKIKADKEQLDSVETTEPKQIADQLKME